MNDKDLRAIRARAEKATEARRVLSSQYDFLRQIAIDGDLNAAKKIESLTVLIIEANDDIPALLAEIDRLSKLLVSVEKHEGRLFDECAESAKEIEWLKAENAALNEACRVAFGHFEDIGSICLDGQSFSAALGVVCKAGDKVQDAIAAAKGAEDE